MTRPSRSSLAVPAALSLALAALAPAAGAAVSSGAARVVARYRSAVGVATDTARTLYTRSTVSGFGFSGTNEVWAARPDRHFSRTVLGPFQLSEGFDGRDAWRTDPTTSKVVRREGTELDDAKSDAYFEWDRWTEPGAAGGDIELAETRRDSAGSYAVLVVRPPAGRERRLWFDEATGLLARSESRNDQQTFVTEWSDWRSAAGRLRPFRTVTRVEGMPLNRLSAEVDSVAVNVSVLAVTFSRPDSGGTLPVTWLGSPGLARLAFDFRAHHLWARVSVDGGPPQDFLVDTGASVTVLDSAWAVANGFRTEGRMEASGAGASGGASFARVQTLRLQGTDGGADGIEVGHLPVAVMSVSPTFEPYFWRPLAGVIGYDVLSRFVLTVDYDRRTLELRDPATFRPAPGMGPAMPLVLNGAIPAVEGVVDGRYRGLFRLDLGSSSTVDLHGPFVRRHALEKRLRHGFGVAGAGFGGTFATRLGRLKRMAIGPHGWGDPIVQLALTNEGAFASEDYAGNIGNRLLKRFRVTLDYDSRRLWLEPGPHATQRDSLSRAGLMVGKVDGRFEVMSVLPGSPADRAGLGAEDELVSVNGRPLGEWDHEALADLLDRGPVGSVVAIVRRTATGEETLRLVLREVLP